jgi:protein TonB
MLLLQSTAMRGFPETPAVLIELSPIPSAPISNQDVAPGPEMEEALPSPDSQLAEPIPDTPVVATPLERPKPKQQEVKREQKKKPPAPKTTAPPRSQTDAPTVSAARAGVASASEIADWRSEVSAHLQRYKQYPSAARAQREEGVASVAFSVDRNGHVLSRQIVRSSGFTDLDQEVLAVLQRAQPLPAFPPSMTQSRIDLTVPFRFSLR